MVEENIYLFHWVGRVEPKARPRSTLMRDSFGNQRARCHLPSSYKEWKDQATASFLRQKEKLGIETITYPIRYYVFFSGKHSRKGDLIDNYPGALADALVDAEVLAKDNANAAPAAIYEFNWSKEPPTVVIAIAPYVPLAQAGEQIQEILGAI